MLLWVLDFRLVSKRCGCSNTGLVEDLHCSEDGNYAVRVTSGTRNFATAQSQPAQEASAVVPGSA